MSATRSDIEAQRAATERYHANQRAQAEIAERERAEREAKLRAADAAAQLALVAERDRLAAELVDARTIHGAAVAGRCEQLPLELVETLTRRLHLLGAEALLAEAEAAVEQHRNRMGRRW